jgi:hypothetical protein
MPVDRPPLFQTRLAHVSPGIALGLLLALLLVIGAGLLMPPSLPPAGGAGAGDATLYRRVAARVAAGQPYYPAAAAEQRGGGYPLKPFTAVRQPLLAEIAGNVGPTGAEWLLRLLAVAAAAATVMRLAPLLKAPFRECAILLSATSAGMFVQPGMWVWHEIWAGLLIALALACRTQRHWLFSVAIGLAAALVREFAFPFLIVMAAAAWTDGSRREAWAWIVAAAVAVTALALHMLHVGAVALPSDVTSPGWLAFGGWRFDLALARQSSLLLVLPPWVTTVVTPLALLGWCAWRSAYALRTAAILVLWMVAFLFVGRPDNVYWGFLLAPLLPVGLALAPAALRDLVRASRPLFIGVDSTPAIR